MASFPKPRPVRIGRVTAIRVAASLLALGATLALVACGGGEGDGPRRLETVSIGKDSTGDELDPEYLAAKGDRLWVVIGNDVASIDARSGKVVTEPQPAGQFEGGALVYDIAAGDEGVWVLASARGRTYLVPVDEASGRPGEPVRSKLDAAYLPAGAGLEVAVGGGRVWAAATESSEVAVLDPATGRQQTIDTGGVIKDLTGGAGYGWVITGADAGVDSATSSSEDELIRLGSDGRRAAFAIDSYPSGVAVQGDSVWVASDSSVERFTIDGKETASVDLEPRDIEGDSVAASDGAVWVLAFSDNKLQRIDPKTGKPDAPPLSVEEPRHLAVAGGYVWVSANYEPVRRARE